MADPVVDHCRRWTRKFKLYAAALSRPGKLLRVVDDQVEAYRRIFAGDAVLASNRTRRVDFALFMVEAIENEALVHEAPAIVGRLAPSALAHADERA